MGNYMSRGGNGRGKIVHWDGSVQEFDKPVTVAELMLEHPQQLVVEFRSAVSQRRPNPLPADQNLETNNIYLMLPMKRGKPLGLNAQDIRRFLLILNSSGLRSSARFLPWLARMCHHPNGVAASHLTQKKPQISEKEETDEMHRDVFPEILQPGRPEYLSRELSGKGWKPSLDTITEKKIKTKISHWLFFKAF
ncbi:hypothetical protein QN277_021702 [Acacia crassicarpa]|uniref:Multidrug resistance protein ABC transporter family protein n=1 Tax=Acacia crassicarpa TaxID=499986 RepID=A0AAE1MQU0_9FABA|nr:hypothetical protein QN277_021702 [Acacia crassicarpa]